MHIYDIPWYDESVEFQEFIPFVLMRSQRPLDLKSSGGEIMSLVTFMNIMSSTYSYITLMYQVIE